MVLLIKIVFLSIFYYKLQIWSRYKIFNEINNEIILYKGIKEIKMIKSYDFINSFILFQSCVGSSSGIIFRELKIFKIAIVNVRPHHIKVIVCYYISIRFFFTNLLELSVCFL